MYLRFVWFLESVVLKLHRVGILQGSDHLPLLFLLITVKPKLVDEVGVLRALRKRDLLSRVVLIQAKCRREVYRWMRVCVYDRRTIVGLDLNVHGVSEWV